jgi:hypothetical protein
MTVEGALPQSPGVFQVGWQRHPFPGPEVPENLETFPLTA